MSRNTHITKWLIAIALAFVAGCAPRSTTRDEEKCDLDLDRVALQAILEGPLQASKWPSSHPVVFSDLFEDEFALLILRRTDWKLRPVSTMTYMKGVGVIDRVTGEKGVKVSLSRKQHTRCRAVVRAEAYSGNVGYEFYEVILKNESGTWVVESVSLEAMG